MKNLYGLLLSSALLCAAGAAQVAFAKTATAEKQQVLVRFERSVKVHDVLLYGEYMIVHDGSLMEQGKPCFFIYTVDKGQPGKLVTTFHCERVARPQANEMKISFYGNGSGVMAPEVKEIQFAGDKEGHRISLKHHH